MSEGEVVRIPVELRDKLVEKLEEGVELIKELQAENERLGQKITQSLAAIHLCAEGKDVEVTEWNDTEALKAVERLRARVAELDEQDMRCTENYCSGPVKMRLFGVTCDGHDRRNR